MTNRETLRDVIEDMGIHLEGVSKEEYNTILLTSIANSLAIIADALTVEAIPKDQKSTRYDTINKAIEK